MLKTYHGLKPWNKNLKRNFNLKFYWHVARMVNIDWQERLCPHTLRTAFLHLPPLFFLSLALSALMLLKAKKNTGYGCKECWFFLECCHGSCFQSRPTEGGCSLLTLWQAGLPGQGRRKIATYSCSSLFFPIHYSQVLDHPQFATGIDPALLTY